MGNQLSQSLDPCINKKLSQRTYNPGLFDLLIQFSKQQKLKRTTNVNVQCMLTVRYLTFEYLQFLLEVCTSLNSLDLCFTPVVKQIEKTINTDTVIDWINSSKQLENFDDVNEFLQKLSQIDCFYQFNTFSRIIKIIKASRYKQKVSIGMFQDLSIRNIKKLSQLSNQLEFSLHGVAMINNEQIDELSKLSFRVKQIQFSRTTFQNPSYFIKSLNTLLNFQSFTISNRTDQQNQISAVDLQELKCANLKRVSLCIIPFDIDSFLSLFRNNPLIQEIEFSECLIEDQFFENLDTKENQFNSISLTEDNLNKRISSVSIKNITSKFSNLSHLRLNKCSRIGSQSVILIASLPKLEHLSLQSCNLTNKAVIHISRLKQLKYLNLPKNCITLYIYQRLFLNCKAIQRYALSHITGSQELTKESIKQFQQNSKKAFEVYFWYV